VSVSGVLVGSALAVLERPRWLVLALAAFLVRGGVLLLLIPIVQAPTTAALANVFGPTLVGFVFGGVSPGFLVLVESGVAVLVAWLVLGGLAGAAIDLALVREAVASEEFGGDGLDLGDRRSGGAGPGRVLVARLIAHLPTAAAVALGVGLLVDAAYQELIHPGDPTLSVPIRVVLRVPWVVVALAGTWLLGEAAGGLAARNLAGGASLPRSLLLAVRGLLRPAGLAVLVLTDVAVIGTAAIGWVILAFAFDAVRTGVLGGASLGGLVAGFILLSVAWFAAAWLLSLATAWRTTAWTFVVEPDPAPRTNEPGLT